MSLKSIDDISQDEKAKIKNFMLNTDMRQYVREFLAQRLGYKQGISKPSIEIPQPTILQPPPDGSHAFQITILSARSFLRFLNPDPSSKLVLDLNIAGRRFRTKPAEADADPLITDVIKFNTNQDFDTISKTGKATLCAVVLAGDASGVYASGSFEWRTALISPNNFAIQLYDPRGDADGVVNIRIEVSPSMCTQDDIDDVFNSETQKNFSIIAPITSRLIPTPYHALRFCSLLTHGNFAVSATAKIVPDQREENNERECILRRSFSIHSLLASRSGTPQEICFLLCSLLCGFGMNAFVSGREVITFHEQNKAFSWDSITGKKVPILNLEPRIMIGLNTKLEPATQKLTTAIDDPRIWRRADLPHYAPPITLSQCNKIDIERIENELKRKICLERRQKVTSFDRNLENALRPLLFSSENQKLNNGNDSWKPHVQYSIAHLIPKFSTFRMETMCVGSVNENAIFFTIRDKWAEMLNSNSEKFALVVGSFPYAEDVCATWVMLGNIVMLK
ncbi:hypothetical protein TVAG_296210 [Trichomonas vaginalis G3]|uniref:Centrosomal protein of 76 kDa C-terminal domain-containing protein n=1 Tax=Trichomonas vaginalis (strain ATCC PRA-98 / G3) TaxID=412133 RepID=A2F770_TRIV3|nr:centrosomal protein of 76 kDa family [Trichomonas vaginalis G3]EAX99237.1 hypothetical protein TVAG_296210 [Trichomonas vaginalis G3]KAI5547944.1 centrosomal protein of 76 kDa family [Trichomonas vaginalis G3]|eukprot:XP_001312167.1 hypothetical protein [Trichomonas vaginalis G3]